ncbi:MAG: hypothetical protein BWY12_01288 [candidate division BRC1 bacterium ADurb.Bin183]|nr:MAG: hypothetical protein BWY12_01288 [candidate division BRC1 bacterium ADurb.Bin183]
MSTSHILEFLFISLNNAEIKRTNRPQIWQVIDVGELHGMRLSSDVTIFEDGGIWDNALEGLFDLASYKFH